MSTQPLVLSVLLGWPIAVASALAGRAALINASFSVPEYAGWLFVAAAPVVTFLMIARGRSTDSIAQVLYNAEHAADSNEKRRR